MARTKPKITQADISLVLKNTEATVSRKLKISGYLTVNDAWIIQKSFFPSMTIDYLFKQDFNGG